MEQRVYRSRRSICLSGGFREEIEALSPGAVVGGSIDDPTTILVRGSAFQADSDFISLSSIVRLSFERASLVRRR